MGLKQLLSSFIDISIFVLLLEFGAPQFGAVGGQVLRLFPSYKLKTKLRGFSPRANYTDRAAAAGRRS